LIPRRSPARSYYRETVRPTRVIIALLALSFAQYWLLHWIATYGDVIYYSVVSHAALFGYCVIGYAACYACDRVLGPRRWAAFALSYGVAAIATSAWYLAIRWLRDWPVTLRIIVMNQPVPLLMFHSVIAGTYFAIRHIDAVSAQARAEQAAAHAELRRLQHQLDPHFLFNNLNILTALIQQAPGDAEQFSRHLAQLYRHLVQHNQHDWVELDDELQFVDNYLHLLGARFGRAYRLTVAVPRGSPYLVIPGALQELLGNIVKHNHASDAEPIDLALRIDGDTLVADSAHRPRRHHPEQASGRGLALLDERYRRQAGRAVEWAARGGRFVVRLPLVSVR
jgi:two-component system LytT family sensor kinase